MDEKNRTSRLGVTAGPEPRSRATGLRPRQRITKSRVYATPTMHGEYNPVHGGIPYPPT